MTHRSTANRLNFLPLFRKIPAHLPTLQQANNEQTNSTGWTMHLNLTTPLKSDWKRLVSWIQSPAKFRRHYILQKFVFKELTLWKDCTLCRQHTTPTINKSKPLHFCPLQIKYTDLAHPHCALKQTQSIQVTGDLASPGTDIASSEREAVYSKVNTTLLLRELNYLWVALCHTIQT